MRLWPRWRGPRSCVVDHVREQLISLLDLRGCGFEYGALLGHPPRLEPDGTVLTRNGHWNVDEAGLPGEEAEVRTFGNGQYCGRFMLTPKPGCKPSLQARLVAVTLADLADTRSETPSILTEGALASPACCGRPRPGGKAAG